MSFIVKFLFFLALPASPWIYIPESHPFEIKSHPCQFPTYQLTHSPHKNAPRSYLNSIKAARPPSPTLNLDPLSPPPQTVSGDKSHHSAQPEKGGKTVRNCSRVVML